MRSLAFPAVAAVTLAGALAFSSTVRAGDSAAVAETGSWQSHEYTFQFLGFTSTYSCDGLAGQLRKLLRAAGARAHVKSVPGACASGFGRPDKFARADLAFYTLTPADSGGGADKAVNGKAVYRNVQIGAVSNNRVELIHATVVERMADLVP